MNFALRSGAPAPAPREVADDPTRSDYERVGGEAGLVAIMTEFVDALFADPMIGFMFEGKSAERICHFEARLAAEHLGGPVVYDGRTMTEAHRRSPISGGHFDRRAKILMDTLERHGVPADIRTRWAAWTEQQRAAVLGFFSDACERP